MDSLLWHLLISGVRVAVGMAVGSGLGFLGGLMLGLNPQVDRWLAGFLFFTVSFPKIVLLPFVIFFFGIGEFSKVVLVAIPVFYQMVIAIRDGVKNVNPAYIDTFATLSTSRCALLRHVVIPAIGPQIFSTLKVSLGTAIAYLFFAETYATPTGIGYYIWDAFSRFDYGAVSLGALVLCCAGWVGYRAVERVERFALGWSLNRTGYGT